MSYQDVSPTDLSEYLREISQYPLLTPDDEMRLARQMSEGVRAGRHLAKLHRSVTPAEITSNVAELEQQARLGLAARQHLVESNLRLVVSIAARYRGHGLSMQDLIQEGNIGLQTGVERFDWHKGYRLSTYVYWWIRQAITRALANDSRTIRLPVHAGEILRSAAQAEQSLAAELGRPPTLAEVAERVGVQSERLSAIRLAAFTPASLDAPLSNASDVTRADTVADELAGDPLQSTVDAADLQQSLDDALDHLTKRERAVLTLHYGVGTQQPWTLDEIGKRMGVSRQRALQIENQAMRRLRNNIQLQRALVELTDS